MKFDAATDDKLTWDWATLTGNTWIEHGKLVATKYFPSSFHWPPHNPAEKISRVIQWRITIKQLWEAHSFLSQFVEEYELLYYQHCMDHLHYCQPCIYTLLHICPKTHYVDLGKGIQQPATPFSNLCQVALWQSQANALKTLCPVLDKTFTPFLPSLSHDLGQGFVLLQPRDHYIKTLQGQERIAILDAVDISALRKWGHLQLLNGQIKLNRKLEFCKVQFYFMVKNVEGELDVYALVSLYRPPNMDILEDSYNMLWACTYNGDDNLKVIPISAIISVVSMKLLPLKEGDPDNFWFRWFVVEKSSLDDIELTGYVDDI
ncbi:hypothetical protein BYT27DRAFT_7226246 [Phlegmacium glaucopus]|nr:hypothetical protein BYT27DRAFT_7226246 [Phlegmacium glaucopus]